MLGSFMFNKKQNITKGRSNELPFFVHLKRIINPVLQKKYTSGKLRKAWYGRTRDLRNRALRWNSGGLQRTFQ